MAGTTTGRTRARTGARGRQRLLVLLAAPALLAQGCAATDSPQGQGAAAATARAAAQPAPTVSPQPPARRYEANTATVLQSPSHGPELCLGGVRQSLPPQCDGIPVPNWNWANAPDHSTRAGTTWGDYHVTGTYDGTTFTVTRITVAQPSQPDLDDLPDPSSPCPTPPGGWPVPNPARTSPEALDATSTAARRQPDFAGLWGTHLKPHLTVENDHDLVLNVAYTGNTARHERELRRSWGGRLCVTTRPRTTRRLERIREELSGAQGKALGLTVLSSGIDESRNALVIQAVTVDAAARAAVVKRYGTGAVRLRAALTPM